jgi:predicted RNA binding protein YcfA (HicA-like mRNA interferase family)
MSKHNSGQHYVKIAEKAGLQVIPGKGDHVKILGPADRGYMIVPLHRELSNGTEYAIKKWFRALGVLILLIGLLFKLL